TGRAASPSTSAATTSPPSGTNQITPAAYPPGPPGARIQGSTPYAASAARASSATSRASSAGASTVTSGPSPSTRRRAHARSVTRSDTTQASGDSARTSSHG